MANNHKPSYAQSIALFVLISVIPLYIFFILVYSVSYRTIREDLLTSISLEGDKIMSDMDAELINLSLRQKECLSLLCTRRITLEDSKIYTNYEIISAKQELAEIITVVLLNSRILDVFDIYFPRTGSMHTNQAGWNAMRASDRAYVDTLLFYPENQLIEREGDYLLYQTSRRPTAPAGSAADVVMVMRASKSKIAAMFSARLPNALRNIYLVKSDTGALIASTQGSVPQETLERMRVATPSTEISLLGTPHYVLSTQSSVDDIMLFYVVAREAVTDPLQRFTTYLILSLVLLAIILLLLFAQSYFFLYKPVYQLLDGFGRIQQGDLSVRLGHANTREFDALGLRFNEMADSLGQLIDQRYKLRILAREAEIKHLYTQINPHFLYNCFFNMQTMLEEENYDCCIDLAHLMGVYLQYLTASRQNTAKLSEELRHARAYADIQSVRFGARVDFVVDALPEGWGNAQVPRLILQPLLENAFEHGIKHLKEGGRIELHFCEEPSRLTISIANGGTGMSPEQLEQLRFHAMVEPIDTQGVALYNISTRLKLMDAEQRGLEFAQSPLGGLCVSFSLTKDHCSGA